MAYDEDKDVFDNEREDEEKTKEEKKPHYKPDQPEYWEQEESQWEHLKPRKSRIPIWLLILCVLVIVGLVTGCWIRFFSPYVEDATQYGYVEGIEKRGILFKTYEGTLIPYKELMDTTRIYNRDFVFSVADQKTATALKEALYANKPVRVGYKKYYATVPWRGANKIVVTSADTISRNEILPPDFAPR